MRRRGVVSAFLFLAAALSGVGWADTPPKPRAVDNAVTLTRPPGLAIEAALNARSEAVTGGWAKQRLPKARVRLGLAVLVGLSILVTGTIFSLTRPSPALRPILRCRWSVALRAPPLLRLP